MFKIGHITSKVARALLFVSSLAATAANATPLPPGATVALSGTTVAAHPYLAGLIMQDVLRPFSCTLPDGSPFSGYVQDPVVQEWKTGYLDFYFRIISSQDYVEGQQMDVIRSNYEGVVGSDGDVVDVDYRLDGLGLDGPAKALRSADGALIDFRFYGQVIQPGSSGSTRFTYVHTHATHYDMKGKLGMFWDGAPEFILPAFEPTP